MKRILIPILCFACTSIYAQDIVNNGTTISLKDTDITTSGAFKNNQGSLVGNGEINAADNESDATISPGFSVGKLDIATDLSMGENSILAIEVDGTAGPGQTGGNDVVNVTGDLTIGGTLAVDFGSFSPDINNDLFTIMTYTGNRVEKFDTVTGLPAGWVVNYGGYSEGEVIIGPESILPVKLVEFTATKVEETALLEWETASEQDNEGFHVQHSTDGINFSNIGWVDGAGNTSQTQNYSFVHSNPENGVNYYRLKQVDFDGEFEYSDIEQLHFDATAKVMVFPNPATNFIRLSLPEMNAATVRIINQNGQLMETVENYQTGQEISIATFAKGYYIAEIAVDGKKESVIFIKQ